MTEEIIKKIAGGVVIVVLGGSAFAVSQTDLINNFAQESGMSQEEAKQYVEETQKDLSSFTEIGNTAKEYGQSVLKITEEIDCANYEYDWETPALNCEAGKAQLNKIGLDEHALGVCYVALDTDLGGWAINKINECIALIDTSTANLDLAMTPTLLNPEDITETRNTNIYNKSVLKSSLESE